MSRYSQIQNRMLSDSSLHNLQMEVQTPTGHAELLNINLQDNPLILARKFCFEHNLDIKLINILAKNIRKFINQQTNKQSKNGEPNKSALESIHGDQTVFDRLYPKMDINNVSTCDKLTPKSPINNGVLIYERNRRITEDNRKKLQLRIQQEQALQESDLTFHPKINTISKLMIQKIRQMSPVESIQQRNYRIKIQKIEQIQKQRITQELQQCTFQPKTNSHSNRSTDRFHHLYQDHHSRVVKQSKIKQALQDQHAFRPQINPISDAMIQLNFSQRQRKYQYQKALKQQKMKRQRDFHSIIESSTGQLLFQPKIGRPPLKSNQQNISIHDQLNHVSKQNQVGMQGPKYCKSSENTCRIYSSAKASSVAQLFRQLDGDEDGFISCTNIHIDSVSKAVLKILAPVLNEMQQMNVTLDEFEFAQSVQRLLKTLTIDEKNVILSHNKKQKKTQNMTFRPKLNKNSLSIANQIRTVYSPGVSLYQYCEQKKLLTQSKIKKQKQQLRIKQLEQCTFKPRLISAKSYRH